MRDKPTGHSSSADDGHYLTGFMGNETHWLLRIWRPLVKASMKIKGNNNSG